MKILFLALDVNLASRAGDAIHVQELVSSLAKSGHEISLVSSKQHESDRINTLGEHANVKLFFNSEQGNYSTLSYCKKIAKENKVEVIYERRFSAKMGATLSKLLKIPLLLEINGLIEEEAEMQRTTMKRSLLGKKVRKGLRRRFFNQAHTIICVTEGIKSALGKEYEIPSDKMVVIHNGANTDIFRPQDMAECRAELEIEEGKKVVCFVGNLVQWQGIEYMVKSMPLISKKRDDVSMMIVGDGVLRKGLERLSIDLGVRDRIEFTGAVPYAKVPTYINASDVCVAPFTRKRNEKIGLSPLKVYEYLSCGKPVIASDIKGVGDLLVKTDTGISVEPENESELARALVELLADEDRMNRMGKNGRTLVIENYGWDSVANRISIILKNTKRVT